jgi:DNA-binding FadR family transcriptional regulator
VRLAAVDVGPGRNEIARVRSPKLSHLVAERLRAQIASGHLGAGDSLPAEAQLLAQFGVSRPTLREALRVLESETLIQLGRGARSGATVLAPSIDAATKYSGLYLSSHGTTIAEINEVRMLIEPSLAGLLAQNRSNEHVRLLREAYEFQRAGLEAKDYAAAVAAIIEFHDVMVRSSENRALGLFAGILHDLAVKVYPRMLNAEGSRERQLVQRRTDESSQAHGKLLDLIARGKAREAEAFWRAYMQDTAKWLARTSFGKLRVKLPSS